METETRITKTLVNAQLKIAQFKLKIIIISSISGTAGCCALECAFSRVKLTRVHKYEN